MNLSPALANRSAALLAAFAVAGAAFSVAGAPAPASAATPYYTATLAQPASEDRTVAGGVAWACKETMCVAVKGPSRPIRICRGLAREFGEITSFTVKDKPMSEEKLAKCNGK